MGLLSKLFGSREIKDEVQTPPQTETPPQTVTSSGSFHFVIDDVFTITGRGTVVTGRVDSGEVRIGDIVNIAGRINTEVTGIEMFRKTLDYAREGDICGLLLKDISREQVNKGDVITK